MRLILCELMEPNVKGINSSSTLDFKMPPTRKDEGRKGAGARRDEVQTSRNLSLGLANGQWREDLLAFQHAIRVCPLDPETSVPAASACVASRTARNHTVCCSTNDSQESVSVLLRDATATSFTSSTSRRPITENVLCGDLRHRPSNSIFASSWSFVLVIVPASAPNCLYTCEA